MRCSIADIAARLNTTFVAIAPVSHSHRAATINQGLAQLCRVYYTLQCL